MKLTHRERRARKNVYIELWIVVHVDADEGNTVVVEASSEEEAIAYARARLSSYYGAVWSEFHAVYKGWKVADLKPGILHVEEGEE
jgi:hypothetical protein